MQNLKLKELGSMTKKREYETSAPKEPQVSLVSGNTFINTNHITGNSVNEHKNLEEANRILGGDEIHQQNENL
jgi:hypothetical protein